MKKFTIPRMKRIHIQSNQKYIICRPLGGLNDCLCQVEYCRKLAKSRYRNLLIQSETGDIHLKHRFQLPFFELFHFSKIKSIPSVSEIFEQGLLTDEKVPDLYKPVSKSRGISLLEFTKGQVRTSKLSKFRRLKHDFEFHESAGGGLGSATLLNHIELNSNVIDSLKQILKHVGKVGVGIHFRSLDWGGGDITHLFSAIEKINAKDTVLIATDDPAIITNVKNQYPLRNFVYMEDILEELQIETKSIELALLELIALSQCEKLEIISLNRSELFAPKFSGYSRLAKHIWAVNTVNKFGLLTWIRIPGSFYGISGFSNKSFNVIYLWLIGIPKILKHAIIPKGVYNQISKLN